MRVLVLGAAGFLGSRLVGELLQRAALPGAAPLDLLLSDQRAPRKPWPAAVRFIEGDVLDPLLFDRLFAEPFQTVFHLAATLTIDAENDHARGLAVNVTALMRLLDRCRAQAAPPKLLFANSISTFGGPLPKVVDDFVFQAPQTSYGAQKVIGEQLIHDASRRGFVDGRILRLPIVLTHPGPPTGSVSDRVAALIREPLRGQDVVSALKPDTPIAVASVDTVIDGLLTMRDLPVSAFGATRAVNLPALSVTPAGLLDAVSRAAPAASLGRVSWQPDAALQRVVEGWPSVFTSAFALAHGIGTNQSIDALVTAHQEATLRAGA